jgi:cathepsin D
MGFPQISVFGASPVFQTLIAEGETTEPVFGFTLETSGSELFLGGTDTSKFTGDLTFTPVTEVGFWEIESGGVSVGGTQVVGPQDSIVDTGTTLVLGDTESVRAVYAAIPGSRDASLLLGPGFFTAPCARFPDNVGLILGGQTFTMSADTFNLGRVSILSPNCVGGLVADDVGK